MEKSPSAEKQREAKRVKRESKANPTQRDKMRHVAALVRCVLIGGEYISLIKIYHTV